MNTSGEAADQVVRMSLEVGEAALKISGVGAQQLAVLLYAVLKEQKKTKGRARLETLVKSGKPLTVFSVKESDLRQFVQEAKRYGILYCAVRDPKGSSDGKVDIMVKEEDAPRINRIVERFQLASVTEAAQIKTEIERSKEGKIRAKSEPDLKKKKPDLMKEEQLVDELLGNPAKNPFLAKTEKSHLSEPISGNQRKSAEGTSKPYQPVVSEKTSVQKELREIQAARKKEAELPKREKGARDNRSSSQKSLRHRHPQAKRKSGRGKER